MLDNYKKKHSVPSPHAFKYNRFNWGMSVKIESHIEHPFTRQSEVYISINVKIILMKEKQYHIHVIPK